MEIQRREVFNQAPAPDRLTDVQRRVFVYPGRSCQRARWRGNFSLSLSLFSFYLSPLLPRRDSLSPSTRRGPLCESEAGKILNPFLTRSKALGVIRSCLEWGQLSAVLVSPRVLSMGRIRKRVQKDWWVQCFPNEQPYTHNYTTEMNGSSWYKLRRGYANCSSNGKAAVSATQLRYLQ